MCQVVVHGFEPIFNQESKVLILGSMPSPKSRENGFYYGHPQNKFWRVISEVLSQPLPVTNDEKRSFLLDHNIAVWDVLHSCKMQGADDTTIKEPIANDLSSIFELTKIKAIFTTGTKATSLYKKYCLNQTKGILPIYLPSTSPANCKHYNYEDLVDAYRVILNYLIL